MKKCFCFLMAVMLFATAAFAQDKPFSVHGKVVNAKDKVPVGGLVLSLRHSKSVTVTGADGSFSLPVIVLPDTIEIAAAGYEHLSFPVSGNVAGPVELRLMPTVVSLDEVVVNTGYQKISKERATGSFTTINSKLLDQQVGTTVLDKLEAVANGLYIDRQTSGAPKIVIRGLSTIQGPRAPLIILDDFPYEGDINNINPAEVENITILKDAAAASIWGTRAGNGVIVITTKKGRYNQPVKVEFTSNVLMTQKPDLFSLKTISAPDYIDVEKMLYKNGFYDDLLNYEPYSAVSPVVELLAQRDLGNITAEEADAGINALKTHDLRNDFDRYIYQKGFLTQTALSLSGGDNRIAWKLSGDWDHTTGVLNDKYDRINLKSSQDFKITKSLSVTTGIDYTQSTSTAGRPGYFQTRSITGNLPVYTQLADADGNALPVMYQYRKAYTDTAGAGKLLDWNWYPLTDPQNIDNSTKQQALLANIGVTYNLRKGISFNLKYQYGRQLSTSQINYKTGSFYVRDQVNAYSDINAATGQITYHLPKGAILDNATSLLESHNIRGQLAYSKQWASQEVNIIAGAEWRQVAVDEHGDRTYGFNPDILSTAHVDYLTKFPNYITGDADMIPDNIYYTGTLNRYISFYANGAYTFHKKYTFSASARRDASNLFGASNNRRWAPLWSSGLGWDISNESFYHYKSLPKLRLRLTYGVSGNADPTQSALTTLLYSGNSPYTQTPIARITQFKNAELGWEKAAMLNIGLDLATAGDRVQGSVEYYHKKGTNLFGTDPVDYTAVATGALIKNVASMTGHGWDIDLNSRNITGKFRWSSQLNVNLNKDRVVKYYLASKAGSNFITGGSISAIAGKPVYALYAYKWAGLDPLTGDPQGYLNGVVSKNYSVLTGTATLITDMQYIGPTLPTTIVSLGNTFNWKAFSMTVRITGKFGNYFQRTSIDYSRLFNQSTGHPDYALRWQKPGDELVTSIPSMVYPDNSRRDAFYRSSAVLATKADLIRLQYITLAYDLKKHAMQCYINLNNLGLLWRANHYGIDPEYNTSLSPSMNMAIGLKATF